jgi:hypothetical protein
MSVTLDFYTSEDVIHLEGMPVGNAPTYLFIVSLGLLTWSNSTNEVWLSKKLNLAYGVSLNLNFGKQDHFIM